MSSSERTVAVKGMHDVLPPESAKWQFIEVTCREMLVRYGFRELRTPALEYTALFARALGGATDIVEKEMYTFQDRDERSVTLRPEGTAGAVRAYLEHAAFEQDPIVKWFYLGPMFRHERPQRGRLRQFHQIGVEVFGVEGPTVDAELLSLAWRMVERLGVAAPELRLSSIGCKACRPIFRARLVAFFEPRKSDLCEDCKRRINVNPMRVLDCKRAGCVAAGAGAPSTLDEMCAACADHFRIVQEDLHAMGVPYEIDRSLVRGLDYYGRTTFEIVASGGEVGAQNAILGGGRYDGLVEELGGPHVPAIGFAMGVERVALAIPREDSAYLRPVAVFVAALGDAARRWSLRTADRLRCEGISVEIDPRGGSLKSQMRRADKLGARVVLLVGDNELAKGTAMLKVMATGGQSEVKDEDLVVAVKEASSD